MQGRRLKKSKGAARPLWIRHAQTMRPSRKLSQCRNCRNTLQRKKTRENPRNLSQSRNCRNPLALKINRPMSKIRHQMSQLAHLSQCRNCRNTLQRKKQIPSRPSAKLMGSRLEGDRKRGQGALCRWTLGGRCRSGSGTGRVGSAGTGQRGNGSSQKEHPMTKGRRALGRAKYRGAAKQGATNQ